MQDVDLNFIKCPIFSTHLNLSSSELFKINEKILNFRENNDCEKKTNLKAWRSKYNTHILSNDFNDINLLIVEKCESVFNNFYKQNINFVIENMWVCLYENQDFAQAHEHGFADFSCCYYVDIEKNASSLLFPPDVEIIPENDMLVLFPGFLYHKVPKTIGKRSLISLNLKFEKVLKPTKEPLIFSYS